MWMTLLDGRHVSSDVAVLDGEPVWWRHTTGEPARGGHVRPLDRARRARPGDREHCGAWIAQHLAGYTGMLNLETIGGRIIEAHLRFADQWPDLYGKGWVEALVRLYSARRWDIADAERRDGYSVVLFGPHGPRYRHPPQALVDEVLRCRACRACRSLSTRTSRPSQHAMPPGGFRLAIVNCFDLAAGRRRAKSCARFFWES